MERWLYGIREEEEQDEETDESSSGSEVQYGKCEM
jgi:hypothetical protein